MKVRTKLWKALHIFLALVLAVNALIVLVPEQPVAAADQLIVTPITWDVVGLDSNRPLTSGPELFPVGAEVCNTSGAPRDITVKLVWGNSDTAYINARTGSLTELVFPGVPNGTCVDAYFEIQLTRRTDAFGKSRPYTIIASYDNGAITASTPVGRQIYIESLVSQNRNTTTQIRYCDPSIAGNNCVQGAGGVGWVLLGDGGSINLAVGYTYFIELTTETATAYEEVQSFLTLSNTIFQILSVETTYSDRSAPADRVQVPNPQLWADGCLWDSNPASPNYNSCLDVGKAGGTVVTLYEIHIIQGGGETIGLEALIYDRSGGSFHYNTDYSQSPGEIRIFDPTNAGFSKRFIPTTIAAGGTATLRFTITNPNPVTVSGYNFADNLPGGMVVADPANASSTCGGTVTAAPGTGTVSFVDGVIGPYGSCTIRVNVTVATAGQYLNESGKLFIGDADTGKNATATLEVTAEPPPPLVCIPLNAAGEPLAQWTSFSSASTPTPTYQRVTGIASATSGSPLAGTFSTSSQNGEWHFSTNTNRTESQSITDGAYFEFRVNTTGVDSVNFRLTAWAQNANAPQTIRLYYGPAGSLQQSVAFTVPQQSNKPTVNNFIVNDLANLNDSGETVFRVYMYNGSGNSPLKIDDATIEGKGEICTPLEGSDPPTPPRLAKAFDPAEVRVGVQTTLVFTLTNPHAGVALTGLTFRDELPAGMTVVAGSLVNNCNVGSSWALDTTNPDALLFTGGTLVASASCTLSVGVVATSVGENLNISDPIDARETLAGNSAEATLDVGPLPETPSIVKFFDPNPLLDPGGTTTLTFRITNNDPALPIVSVAFTDRLPAVGSVQMVPSDPFQFTDNGRCGSSRSFTWVGPTNTLSFSGGEIAAGEVCEIQLNVAVPGVNVSGGAVLFPNETSRVSHVFNGTTYEGNAARATLLVDEPIPGIALRKEVGLSNNLNGTWSNYLRVEVGTDIFYKLTIENIGEIALAGITVSDPTLGVLACTWSNLPMADAATENHIADCIVGPVPAQEGLKPNTATANSSQTDEVSDDADYEGYKPTRVTLTAFHAYTANRQVVVEWETASEFRTLGFYLERLDEATGEFIRLNDELLPGLLTSSEGGVYRYVDASARSGGTYTYRLVEVEINDKQYLYGPFTVTADGSGAALMPGEAYRSQPRGQSAEQQARVVAAQASRQAASELRGARSGLAIKLSVAETGLYYLDAAEIARLLNTPVQRVRNLIRNANLALTNQGRQVAYLPADGNAGLYFYGEAPDSLYTRDNVYWIEEKKGLHISILTGRGPAPVAGQPTFKETLRFEADRIPLTGMFTEALVDFWAWDYVIGSHASLGSKSFSLRADGATASGAATLAVDLWGANDTAAELDHHVVVFLNGRELGQAQWGGIAPHSLTLAFDPALLVDGDNTVKVTALRGPDVSASVVYINAYDLSYPRYYQAMDDALALRGDGHPVVSVAGFAGPAVWVFDVSQPSQPVLVKATTIDRADGGYRVSFRPAAPQAEYLALTAGQARVVETASAAAPSNLRQRNNDADYVIIAPLEFIQVAQALAGYRQAQGYATMVVDLEAIYNEFNAGLASPEAIRTFLDYAYHRWRVAPRYVVLAGQGTFDYMNFQGRDDNFLPPLLVGTPHGLFAADNRLADVVGNDGIPEMAIGRLPVVSAAELEALIAKIIAYENAPGGDWTRRVMLVADQVDPQAGNFPADSDAVGALLPPTYTADKTYLGIYTTVQARQRIQSGLNQGAVLFNYIGHSGMDRMANAGLLRTADVAALANGDRLPIVTTLTCLVGRHEMPGYTSLGEALVLAPRGGAAAVWAPTGLSYNAEAKLMNARFFQRAFVENEKVLGEIVLDVLADYAARGQQPYMLDIYTLLGDPALRMP